MPLEPENPLLRLAQISGALNAFHTLSFSADGSVNLLKEANNTLEAIRRLAGDGERSEIFFNKISRMLCEKEYVLPRELESVHAQVLKSLKQDKTLQASAYSGLLLTGIKGSGKSEYPLFLRSLLEDTPFFSINPNILRSHNNPPKFLEALLSDLQAQAVSQSKIVVLFLDEFDAIVTSGGTLFSQTKTSSSDSSTGKRIHSSSSREETNALETDAMGTQLINTLKSLVGSADLDRVFLIATTNLSELPDAIHRAGRLQKVEMGPLGWSYPRSSYGEVFIYDIYRDIIPRALDIMQATQFRISQTYSDILSQLKIDILSIFQDLPDHVEQIKAAPKGKTILSSLRDDNPIIRADDNQTTLNKVLGFLQFDLSRNNPFSSGIRFNSSLDYFKIENGKVDENASSEIKAALSMTAASISAYYKINQERFASKESAIIALRELFFPQLIGYKPAKT